MRAWRAPFTAHRSEQKVSLFTHPGRETGVKHRQWWDAHAAAEIRSRQAFPPHAVVGAVTIEFPITLVTRALFGIVVGPEVAAAQLTLQVVPIVLPLRCDLFRALRVLGGIGEVKRGARATLVMLLAKAKRASEWATQNALLFTLAQRYRHKTRRLFARNRARFLTLSNSMSVMGGSLGTKMNRMMNRMGRKTGRKQRFTQRERWEKPHMRLGPRQKARRQQNVSQQLQSWGCGVLGGVFGTR